MVLPSGSIPRYPFSAEAVFEAVGAMTAAASVSVSASAPVSGSGAATASSVPVFFVDAGIDGVAAFTVDITPEADIAFTGSGSFGVDAVPVFDVQAGIFGVGGLGVDAIAVIDVPAPVSGAVTCTTAVSAVVVVDASLAGAGALAASATMTSTSEMPVSGAAAFTVAAELVLFTASGIDKASPNQTTTLSTYTEITGWQERSAFTGSNFTTRGLVLPAGITVDLVSRCTRPATSPHASMTHRLLANGVVIINGTTNANTTQADGTYTTTEETLITMESFSSSSSFDRLIVAAGVNTYITATRV